MAKNILIIQGHPDTREDHLCHALAAEYRSAATDNHHEVRLLSVANLDFPLIANQHEFEHGEVPADIEQAQQAIQWCDHLVIIYPLWLGTMPALLKGFLEQTMRYGFALSLESKGMPKRLLKGKSARLIVTMGMPAFVYRWFFGAHGVISLERNILKLCGIKPVNHLFIGMVEDNARADKWFKKVRKIARAAR